MLMMTAMHFVKKPTILTSTKFVLVRMVGISIVIIIIIIAVMVMMMMMMMTMMMTAMHFALVLMVGLGFQ